MRCSSTVCLFVFSDLCVFSWILPRLSKELQQKDKIIESLRSKLKEERPDTPSSTHALSETTDQSDRNSFVSDEQGSVHEDLDLCSDVDAASEYAQEGGPSPRQQTQTGTAEAMSANNSHFNAHSTVHVHTLQTLAVPC